MGHNPFDTMRELATMQNRMNRLWGGILDSSQDDVTSRGTWQPPVDIYETDTEIVLKIDLPGLKREDIDLTVENSTLTVRGERRQNEVVREDRYHRIERLQGGFSRSFTLPNTVDGGRTRAEYRDGVLTVTLPLREEGHPRQIRVEVDG